jgi:hypothetical protein
MDGDLSDDAFIERVVQHVLITGSEYDATVKDTYNDLVIKPNMWYTRIAVDKIESKPKTITNQINKILFMIINIL